MQEQREREAWLEVGETQDPVPASPVRACKTALRHSSREPRFHNKYIFLHSNQKRELKHFFFLELCSQATQTLRLCASKCPLIGFQLPTASLGSRLSQQFITGFLLGTGGSTVFCTTKVNPKQSLSTRSVSE